MKLDQAFTNLLRSFLPDLRADQEVTADLELVAHGLDSLQTVSLIVALEEEYDVTFSDWDLTPKNFSTPQLLWQLIQKSAMSA